VANNRDLIWARNFHRYSLAFHIVCCFNMQNKMLCYSKRDWVWEAPTEQEYCVSGNPAQRRVRKMGDNTDYIVTHANIHDRKRAALTRTLHTMNMGRELGRKSICSDCPMSLTVIIFWTYINLQKQHKIDLHCLTEKWESIRERESFQKPSYAVH
jgi:hypothetical protein